jgi:hypothetical protein
MDEKTIVADAKIIEENLEKPRVSYARSLPLVLRKLG